MTYQATDIAKYIINKCTIEKHAISNLQLQEILYYIQKKFLEIELKAFEDDFEACQVDQSSQRYITYIVVSVRWI